MTAAATEARFVLPPGSEATAPPEARGLARDEVRMAVVTQERTHHRQARELPLWLEPGDLLVVNTSATLPSRWRCSGTAARGGCTSPPSWTTAPGWSSCGDPMAPGRACPSRARCCGCRAAYGCASRRRTRPARPGCGGRRPCRRPTGWRTCAATASPIRYPYLHGAWPIEDLQNVYAAVPGSAEMPSAGRPLSREVLVDLMSAGVVVAPLVLHTGVASQESHEPPQPEWLSVPESTARLVNVTSAAGGRVVAVGTTVVRALETAASVEGAVSAYDGWTSLVLSSARPARVVSGLLTGLHEPEASHLDLLEAVAGRPLVDRAYADITAPGAPHYLWHEFGDSMLLLP